jgi:pyruvate dehydrogenase E2 component (dihydrolipoamide acetyltransferase)
VKRGNGALPAVLIHGFTGSLNNWLFNHAALAADRSVFALDLPGHGQSSKDVGDGSLETLVVVLRDWLDELGLSRVHLIGHSLGGAIVLNLALRDPDRVRSCTLIASAGLGPEVDADYVGGVVDADRRKQLKPFLERLFANPGLVTRPMVDDLLKYKRLDGVRQALSKLASNMVVDGRQMAGMRDRLEAIQMPTLVIWGDQDQIIPASHAADLPERFTVRVIDGCGHLVQMEAAAEVNRLIAEFLESTGR